MLSQAAQPDGGAVLPRAPLPALQHDEPQEAAHGEGTAVALAEALEGLMERRLIAASGSAPRSSARPAAERQRRRRSAAIRELPALTDGDSNTSAARFKRDVKAYYRRLYFLPFYYKVFGLFKIISVRSLISGGRSVRVLSKPDRSGRLGAIRKTIVKAVSFR